VGWVTDDGEMSWIITEDLERYLAEAGEFLRADPAENTVPLATAESMRAQGSKAGDAPSMFGWWRSGTGEVAGTCMRTGTYPLLLSLMPDEAVEELVELLAEHKVPVPGVNAQDDLARTFAVAWEIRADATSIVKMRQRLYRLDRLERPTVPGTPRVATSADLELAEGWYEAFGRDTGTPGDTSGNVIADKMSYGGIVLWEVDGVPVSLGGRTRVVAGMARIAPIYTPPEHRRRGYGAAITAVVTQDALDAGAHDVVLFTDVDNPTSNNIYQSLGFRPLSDRLLLAFV
jgi:predicted GNAT family acetyltransferase